ncbi:cupin domain-containing protein [Bradyrhizobium sp. INPA01-394B]|uniref:Cupin domain-containing protein n=1 Tax=Bradyrhizobium campsiandrae TaxID=1729892 RepID=A0ABR7U679_9BRAD|nr:cupin domain-containing protein [Bradyrhizobium campsiandrae]MBC9881663.1 cupin domain-containing protein [Bradyrhizobium campsiandrae]MBC9979492.1 cupin domain-containing protein [Bradyrhizobium campsiandrae]
MTALNLATMHRPVPLRSMGLAVVGGLACALAIGRVLPVTMDTVSGALAPLCAAATESSPLDKVEPIGSYALPNVPGKRVTIVRVFYGPGGFSRPHRHAGSVTAYITKGEIRSQLGGGSVETFGVGQSFFEPPGATHLVSANASIAEPAELIAVFVADEGAPLTTYLD